MKDVYGICLLFFVLLVPVWLYASGNMPLVAPHNEGVIRRLKMICPEISHFSYYVSHKTFEAFRAAGVEVPLSRNERLADILEIRRKAIEICDSIPSDN
jgi:hypothetical protein